jgi:hypothetical protein
MPNKCIYCGSFDLKEEEDRSKPPVTFIPRPMYPKKFTCKKCRKSFSKEQMDNPSASADGAEAQPETSAKAETTPAQGSFSREPAAAPTHGPATKPATAGFSSESHKSPGFSSSPAPSRPSSFATLESDAAPVPPQEKKSYMQIMKEKQQYQSQQFQDTIAAEQQAAKPAAKPATKPATQPAGGPVARPADGPVLKPAGGPVLKPAGGPVLKPAGGPVARPAGGPVMKPVGMKPPAPEPAAPTEALPAELPDLEALPDLPPIEASAPEVPQPEQQAEQPPAEQEAIEPAAPALAPAKPAGLAPPSQPGAPVMKPAGGPVMKPVGMKPPVKPAGGPVVKPAGMKPPVKPAGGLVVKPAGMKPPAPAAPAPSAFQSFEVPAPKYVPPVLANEPTDTAAPAFSPATPSISNRLQQLLGALEKVLGNLSWPQDKKDMLKQELVSLPEDEQITFLEQLGVEIPPEHEAHAVPVPTAPAIHVPVAPAVPAPVAYAPVAPSPVVPAPVAHVPAVPVPNMPSMISPPMKPIVAMKPPVSPPVQVPGGMPGHPVVKPAGMKPPIKPPVAVPGPAVVKPAGVNPPVKPAMKPSAAAVDLFNNIDQQIEQTVSGEFDLDNFLDTGLELNFPDPDVPAPMPRPFVPPPAPVGEAENGATKPLIKVSQISTKVEKKTDADLKREEERQRAQSATESSLVYMRLLAFEKACSIPKTFKLADFSKMLKDLDQQNLANFIVAVNNDFIIAYDDEKKQIVVSEISGPEMEFLARQFEKWMRFGRL